MPLLLGSVAHVKGDAGIGMTDVVNKRLLAFGHSHLNALRHAYRRFYNNNADGKAPFSATFIKLHQDIFQPNVIKEGGERSLNEKIEHRYQALIRRDEPDVIVSCALGNEYNSVALANHPQRFDFYLPNRPDLPTDETAEVLPVDLIEDLIRSRLGKALQLYLEMMSRHGSVPKIHVPPPPPIRDAAYIEAYPSAFAEKAKKFGISPSSFRLKMWLLTCEVQRRLCDAAGVIFHRLPKSIFDPDGFFAEPFLNEDPSHGNTDYGKIILDDIARTSFPRLATEITSERTSIQKPAESLFLAARS